jgi:general secretion pathway protein H
MTSPCSRRGFSLLELLLVLVIIGAASVMLVRVGGEGVSTSEMKGAARSLAAALRLARSDAVTTRAPVAVLVDLERREFQLGRDEARRALPRALDITIFTAEQEVVSDKLAAIRFYGDGSSTGGRVTLASGSRKFEVDVDWLTGRVKILD